MGSAEASYGAKIPGMKGVGGATVTVGVKYGSSRKEKESKSHESYFEDTQEYSLGKRLPNSGGVQAWMKLSGGEPMPVRYGLRKVCEHPALKLKKRQCEQAWNTYCRVHLTKSTPGFDCNKNKKKPECVWDQECMPYSKCVKQKCVREPDCTLTMYKTKKFKGKQTQYGPVYYSETPQGQIFSTREKKQIQPGQAEVAH